MKPFITVFTPTYNRAYTIYKLYESLKKQQLKDFEWIIYDDGSTDNTEDVVNEFINEQKIIIKYFKVKNSGKHVAINNGTDLAEGELFFIVDSDDYLTEDSLITIKQAWDSIDVSERNNFAGVSGKRKLINKKNSIFNFNNEYYDADAIKFNLIDNNVQDKAEVYVTNVLKKYKFPKYDGENFMTEAVIWYKIAQDGYLIRWFNKDIYVCEYLEDGLTANFYERRINSILGTCYSYNKLSSYNLPLKYKIRYKSNYFRYGLNEWSFRQLFNNLEDSKFKYISSIIGYLMYIIDRNKLNRARV